MSFQFKLGAIEPEEDTKPLETTSQETITASPEKQETGINRVTSKLIETRPINIWKTAVVYDQFQHEQQKYTISQLKPAQWQADQGPILDFQSSAANSVQYFIL